MGRTGVTFEEFMLVARPLHEQRMPVTVDRIREALGRGSRTTLLKHLQKWRQDIALEIPAFSLAEAPTSLVPLLKELWHQAGLEAQAQLNEARQALEHEQLLLRERDQVREGQLKTLTEQLANAQRREQSTAVELTVTKENLGRVLADNQHLRLYLEQAQRDKETLSTKLQEAEHGAAEQKQAAVTQLASERARHDVELARWLQQLDATKQQLRELSERCQKFEKPVATPVKRSTPANKPVGEKATKPEAKAKRQRKPIAKRQEQS